MPINILMPALSPTMEKGNLAKWHVKEGDAVRSGDVIAEIETDKATMEVEAVDEGTVGKILVPEGASDVPVNQPIAVLLGEGEDAGAILAEGQQSVTSGTHPSPSPAGNGSANQGREKSPEKAAGERGYGVTPGEAPVLGGGETGASPLGNGSGTIGREAHGGTNRIFASPLARRLARDSGIDLGRVRGTGPRGRIIKRDIDETLSAGVQAGLPAAGPEVPSPAAKPPEAVRPAVAPAVSDAQIKALFEPGSFEERPHDAMRRIIAKRLLESKLTIPHFYLTIDVSLDRLLELRRQLNEAAPKEGQGAFKLSVNDFVIKAMALALQRVPMANATWTENARLLHRHSDVGVAVAVPEGLFTPVIRKAETKTLSAISNEMKDLATRARSKKLKPEEYQGGSTAVSNLGMYGIKDFAAVINPPHATILAVGAGEQRVIVRDGAPAVANIMSCTLSCDHRVVDGALGAELLAAFKALIESPIGMLV